MSQDGEISGDNWFEQTQFHFPTVVRLLWYTCYCEPDRDQVVPGFDHSLGWWGVFASRGRLGHLIRYKDFESGCSVCYWPCSAYFFLPYSINCAETSEWHKTINQLRSVTASHSLLCCCIYQLCLYYIINVCGLSDFARLPFCLCLVRAPLTVPGHSGTPVIEAELREGTDRRDQGGVDVTSPAGPWHHSGRDRK